MPTAKQTIDRLPVALPFLLVLFALPAFHLLSPSNPHPVRTVDFLQIFAAGCLAGVILRGAMQRLRG